MPLIARKEPMRALGNWIAVTIAAAAGLVVVVVARLVVEVVRTVLRTVVGVTVVCGSWVVESTPTEAASAVTDVLCDGQAA